MNLQNKKILIAVTGGIAAYKINILVRDFIKKGAEVQVVMTPAAKDFITPLTLGTLSKKQPYLHSPKSLFIRIFLKITAYGTVM